MIFQVMQELLKKACGRVGIKGSGHILRRSITVFDFCIPCQLGRGWGHLLNKSICSYMSKFYLVREDSLVTKRNRQEVTKLALFEYMAKILVVYGYAIIVG